MDNTDFQILLKNVETIISRIARLSTDRRDRNDEVLAKSFLRIDLDAWQLLAAELMGAAKEPMLSKIEIYNAIEEMLTALMRLYRIEQSKSHSNRCEAIKRSLAYLANLISKMVFKSRPPTDLDEIRDKKRYVMLRDFLAAMFIDLLMGRSVRFDAVNLKHHLDNIDDYDPSIDHYHDDEMIDQLIADLPTTPKD